MSPNLDSAKLLVFSRHSVWQTCDPFVTRVSFMIAASTQYLGNAGERLQANAISTSAVVTVLQDSVVQAI